MPWPPVTELFKRVVSLEANVEPQKHFMEQSTQHKRAISLLESRVHTLENTRKEKPKDSEALVNLEARLNCLETINQQMRTDIIRQQTEIEDLRNRGFWARVFNG